MISVVIATHESEQLLVPTLAALVPGALSGVLREVIVTDGGSSDATATVADVAGCSFVVSKEPTGARLKAAAASARSPWLLFLRPGTVPDAIWIDETSRFIQEAELGGNVEARVAVFRPAATIGGRRPLIVEALALIAAAFGALPRPGQGSAHLQTLLRAAGRSSFRQPRTRTRVHAPDRATAGRDAAQRRGGDRRMILDTVK